MSRRDGLRAQPCDPRAVSAINGPKSPEDRLLLLGLIGDAIRKVPAQQRRALFLAVRDGLTPVELATHLGCSEWVANRTLREGWEMLGRRLRHVGVVT
jgi:DNA-directed RNA polymerase specialized sigma24 family protein